MSAEARNPLEGFVFSQSSLQDYADCPRRFQLRYVEAQPWPAVQSEPLLEREQHAERGQRFHRLVQRHQIGIDPARLALFVGDDPDLAAWWAEYLAYADLHHREGQRLPEYPVVAELDGARLQAKYDLLVIEPSGAVTIFDWKTYQRMPPRAWFESRLQTRVYPYLLARAGGRLTGGAIAPGTIRMVYWLPAFPAEPVVFTYSQAQYEQDEAALAALLTSIRQKLSVAASTAIPAIWPLTSDVVRCRFCEYRSLCDRGDVAGIAADDVIDSDFPASDLLGLEDVEEVGF